MPWIRLPWQIPARVRDLLEVRLLYLSVGGTHLEHLGLLRSGVSCEIELTPAGCRIRKLSRGKRS